MARDLTIQIRLTKEEHATIAAQAEREGLGVGTYLRALALRSAFESSATPRGRAMKTIIERELREDVERIAEEPGRSAQPDEAKASQSKKLSRPDRAVGGEEEPGLWLPFSTD